MPSCLHCYLAELCILTCFQCTETSRCLAGYYTTSFGIKLNTGNEGKQLYRTLHGMTQL